MPGRQPLFTFVALCAIPLPACLHIGASAVPTTTPEPSAEITAKAKTAAKPHQPVPPRLDFAVLPKLPKVPGTVISTKPDAPATPDTAAHKPTTLAPTNPVRQAVGEPGPFPPLSPGDSSEPLLLAIVRAYVEGHPEQVIEMIRRLDKNNQEIVLAVLPVLARSAGTDLTNDPVAAAALVEQLRSAVERLEPRAALKIEKVAFCSEVEGFGRFVPRSVANPYPPNEKAELYLELRNLGSQPAADGFLTHVHAAVEIRDANDKLVAQIEPGQNDLRRRVPVVKFEKKLVTRSPLHDFHVLYIFSTPPAPGVYTVTVVLSDPAGRRTVKSVPAEFRVAGP